MTSHTPKPRLRRSAVVALLALLAAGSARAESALPSLQPAVYLQYRFGGGTDTAGALHAGLQWSYSDRVLDGLAARLDPDRHRDAESLTRSAYSLRAALPALLHLDWSSRRQFSTRLFGSELLGHSPPQLQADGSTSGGWRWSSGMTWLAIGVAATATAALTLEGGGPDDKSFENGGDGSGYNCTVVGGDTVVPPRDLELAEGCLEAGAAGG